MGHLFISYSTQDGAAQAKALVHTLEAAGYPCWIAPRDVKPGIPYPGQIVAAIRECAGFVLIVTPSVNKSVDVLQEVSHASGMGKVIAPVVVAGTTFSDDLAYYFKVRHQIAWTEAGATSVELVRTFDGGRGAGGAVAPGRAQAPVGDGALRAIAAAAAGKPVAERLFGDRLTDGNEGPQMVAIPAGAFPMGSPPSEEARRDDEGPQRRVAVPAFAAGIHPVTWAEYERAVAAKACPQPADDGFGKSARPVTNVSWDDAQAFCGWLSKETAKTYRLLTEAEWEYGCRAGTTTPFSFGPRISTAQANYDGNFSYGSGKKGEYRKKTTPAGSFSANAFGLHDMHGSVREWVEDCYADSYSAGQPSDGRAFTKVGCFYRVNRGGSWNYGPQYLRSANRLRYAPAYRNYDLGFRVARTLFAP